MVVVGDGWGWVVVCGDRESEREGVDQYVESIRVVW